MGSMLMTIGKQMISADDKEESFETRMEKFADSIEKEISARADKIKVQAQGLCRSIVKVDSLEEQLKDNIKSLSHIDVFTLTYGQYDDKKHASSI
jgi:septation ring formation regulator EzrA